MAAQELRWLTYLLTDLREWPRSSPILYVDNKQRGHLCLTYVATRANTADIFVKALHSVVVTSKVGSTVAPQWRTQSNLLPFVPFPAFFPTPSSSSPPLLPSSPLFPPLPPSSPHFPPLSPTPPLFPLFPPLPPLSPSSPLFPPLPPSSPLSPPLPRSSPLFPPLPPPSHPLPSPSFLNRQFIDTSVHKSLPSSIGRLSRLDSSPAL
ncbi:unnamed protein product [Closterium sp. NIES-53]